MLKDFVKNFGIYICIIIIGIIFVCLSCWPVIPKIIKTNNESANIELYQRAYREGYNAACRDFHECNFQIVSVEKENGIKNEKHLNADHKKRRGCIGQCEDFSGCFKLTAWDDKNYFEGNKNEVIEQLNRWNAEDYYELKRIGCPKCGSFNIMENGQRGRMVITSLRCKDCGYIWRIKKWKKEKRD